MNTAMQATRPSTEDYGMRVPIHIISRSRAVLCRTDNSSSGLMCQAYPLPINCTGLIVRQRVVSSSYDERDGCHTLTPVLEAGQGPVTTKKRSSD